MASGKGTGSVTVDDVAAQAGVSIKTVSRVLNNEPNTSEKTRAKVMAAIELLKYQPNPSARRLASKRSDLIMLVYDNPSDNYLINIQQGALDACRRYFYSLLLQPCDYRAEGLAEQIAQAARQRACAGVVLTPPVSDVPALIDALDRGDMPYVRLAPSYPSVKGLEVSTDDRSAARDMTRYLIGLGHRRIGFVAGHPDHGAAHERLRGYCDALAEGDCKSTTAWSSRACIPLIPACIAAIGCWIAPTGPAPFSPATTTWRRVCCTRRMRAASRCPTNCRWPATTTRPCPARPGPS